MAGRFISLVVATWSVWCAAAAEAPLRGVVRDVTGAVVAGAEVEIRGPTGAILSVQRTSSQGEFEWREAPHTLLQLRVMHAGFAAREMVLPYAARNDAVEIRLEPASVYSRVTVNATRGGAEEAAQSAHLAVVVERQEILSRPIATLGNAFEQEAGVLVQQSTYGQVSPTLRGLTGYHVLNLIDGVRFNNAAFRSGPNQYLAFVEPSQAERVEALLGPTGSQYGSDSLGGTIQVVTEQPRFASRVEERLRGEFTIGGATGDLSARGAARLAHATARTFWLASVSGRRHNDLRAGGGYDSRNVFHRLFGMTPAEVRRLLGERQKETGFRQYGMQGKIAVRPRADQLWTAYYLRGEQDGVRGYKDLLGGLGRLQSAFEPQVLDWFYSRYEKQRLGALDTLAGTISVNSQADGSARQGLRATDAITRDFNRIRSYGYTLQATAHGGSRLLAAFGADLYDERIRSRRQVHDPVSGTRAEPRPLYPDGSSYRTLGAFAQASADLTSGLRAAGGMRLTGVRFRVRAEPRFGIPESSQSFRDVTFHSSLRWQATKWGGAHAVVSRGFRAPNLNDLGALGLNDLGYEIPAAEALAAGALLSSDAGETAVSKGVRLRALAPESLMNYEFGVRINAGRLYARTQFFDTELYDPIVRRTLLFPAGSPPSQLAGLPVSPIPPSPAQRAQGVTAVAVSMDPRAVKAFVNDGRARYYGLETLARYRLSARWTWEGNYSFIVGRDLNPNRPIRRLPPQMGAAKLRYTPSGRRPWWEVCLAAAGEQSRLSGGDRDDERIGASFRRRDIQDFFHASRAAPYVRNGVFQPTGETLAQIQNRVLPLGAVVRGVRIVDDATRVPLYLSTAGWAALHLRGGAPLSERWRVGWALENLLDRNYRVHGSGIDAPGVSAYLSLAFRF